MGMATPTVLYDANFKIPSLPEKEINTKWLLKQKMLMVARRDLRYFESQLVTFNSYESIGRKKHIAKCKASSSQALAEAELSLGECNEAMEKLAKEYAQLASLPKAEIKLDDINALLKKVKGIKLNAAFCKAQRERCKLEYDTVTVPDNGFQDNALHVGWLKGEIAARMAKIQALEG